MNIYNPCSIIQTLADCALVATLFFFLSFPLKHVDKQTRLPEQYCFGIYLIKAEKFNYADGWPLTNLSADLSLTLVMQNSFGPNRWLQSYGWFPELVSHYHSLMMGSLCQLACRYKVLISACCIHSVCLFCDQNCWRAYWLVCCSFTALLNRLM